MVWLGCGKPVWSLVLIGIGICTTRMGGYVRTTGGAENETDDAGRAEGPMMLAYEIDGFGSFLKMDDANVPSLLSLPYIGYIARCVLGVRFLRLVDELYISQGFDSSMGVSRCVHAPHI